jgi:transcription elongation factor Elf1
MADAFVVIDAFSSMELGEHPLTLLGEKAWQTLLDVATVYTHQLDECTREKEKIKWGNPEIERLSSFLGCSECGSELLKPINPEKKRLDEIEFRCSNCGETSEFSSIANSAIEECFFEMYLALTKGGDAPLEHCHGCGQDTFLVAADECIFCGTTRVPR